MNTLFKAIVLTSWQMELKALTYDYLMVLANLNGQNQRV